jgi:hypothetical protein
MQEVDIRGSPADSVVATEPIEPEHLDRGSLVYGAVWPARDERPNAPARELVPQQQDLDLLREIELPAPKRSASERCGYALGATP